MTDFGYELTGHTASDAAAWVVDASCAETDPELFFPEQGGGFAAIAKAICRGCSVRDECLDYALQHDIDEGIWGGVSPRDRRKLTTTTERNDHDRPALQSR